MLLTLLFESFNWIAAMRFAELIELICHDPKCRRPRTFWKKNISVFFEKNFLFQLQIYVLYTLIPFNIEKLNSGASPQL